MRTPWAAVVIAATSMACQRKVAAPPAHVIDAAVAVDAAVAIDAASRGTVRTAFPVLSEAQRTARGTELAKLFGATSATADFAGYPATLQIPMPTAPADREAYARTFILDHAQAFGIRDPAHLVSARDGRDGNVVDFGVAPRWWGALRVAYLPGTLMVWGHLWPIAIDAERPIRPDSDFEPAVKPFIGATADFLSLCLPCKDTHEPITRASFSFVQGIAFMCDYDAATPRAVVLVVTHWRRGARVSVKDEVPEILDATSLEVIHLAYTMPPLGSIVDGKLERGEGGDAPPHDTCHSVER